MVLPTIWFFQQNRAYHWILVSQVARNELRVARKASASQNPLATRYSKLATKGATHPFSFDYFFN